MGELYIMYFAQLWGKTWFFVKMKTISDAVVTSWTPEILKELPFAVISSLLLMAWWWIMVAITCDLYSGIKNPLMWNYVLFTQLRRRHTRRACMCFAHYSFECVVALLHSMLHIFQWRHCLTWIDESLCVQASVPGGGGPLTSFCNPSLSRKTAKRSLFEAKSVVIVHRTLCK